MQNKAKGSNAERELIHLFWEHGWAAARIAGSGSTKFPAPDLLAGNNLRKLAIECKAIGGKNKYIAIEQIDELSYFSKLFGAEAWVGLRFNRMEWLFVPASELERTENSFRINIGTAKRSGLLFEELIR